VNEVQEALNRPVGLIQYHSLGLMYYIKQHDKMAVTKIIQTLSRGNLLRSPLSYCMLIRFTFKVMDDEGGMDGCVFVVVVHLIG
jgi:coatomer protein complex subunit gamma